LNKKFATKRPKTARTVVQSRTTYYRDLLSPVALRGLIELEGRERKDVK
jgi:hypothetical protein